MVRYSIPIATAVGLGSPLARSWTVVKYLAAAEMRRDMRRVEVRVDRLRSQHGSENRNVGTMSVVVTLKDLAPEATESAPSSAPDSIIPGRIRELPGTVPSVDTPPPLSSSSTDDAPNYVGRALAGGDDWSRKQSPLSQINASNVGRLRLIRAVDSRGGKWRRNIEAPPLAHEGLIYWRAADDELIATQLVSGARKWHIKLPGFDYTQRGFLLREGDGKRPSILYVPFGPFIAAINAKAGTLITGFGDHGILKPGASAMSPLLWGGELLVALLEQAAIVGVDVDTGRENWRVPLHDPRRNFQGAVPWGGGMAIDRARALLFVSTGNPRPPLSGISRPGDNRNSNSVVAVDLVHRRIRWAFQEVRHDLWDFDIPASPMLSAITVNGRRYDVVIAVTKVGNTLILDRDSGTPIFDFRLRRAPASRFPGEHTSDWQPAIDTPEPISGIEFDTTMLTNIAPASRSFVARQVQDGKAIFGWFRPPELNRDLITFGIHGGAEWPGASVGREGDFLYVPVNRIPWALRVYLRADPSYTYRSPFNSSAQALYVRRCASCHLPSRDGRFESVGEAATIRIPSLHGYTLAERNRALFSQSRWRLEHPGLEATQPQLDSLWHLFGAMDRDLFDRGSPSLEFSWRQLLDSTGLPASAPPWGKIVALNLTTGRKAWEVPFGTKVINGDTLRTGSPNYGGLISTSGHIIFATGTDDGDIIALDATTGSTLWRYHMVAAGSAPPITFMYQGKQYLCVISTGGRFHSFRERASRLYIFSL
ncbi:MAG: PQQ-binding-like beta-propeller repeat protein [Gemmatimonadales bacterium]